jgi:hypothetical protein
MIYLFSEPQERKMPLPGSDSSARLEIVLPAVLPVGECRSSGSVGRVHQRRGALDPCFAISPVDSRQQVQNCGSSFPQ